MHVQSMLYVASLNAAVAIYINKDCESLIHGDKHRRTRVWGGRCCSPPPHFFKNLSIRAKSVDHVIRASTLGVGC